MVWKFKISFMRNLANMLSLLRFDVNKIWTGKVFCIEMKRKMLSKNMQKYKNEIFENKMQNSCVMLLLTLHFASKRIF